MLIPARSRLRGASTIVAIAATAGFLVACTSSQPTAEVSVKKRSKEYFAESEYGVKASPRVTMLKSNLPRGGGREQVGKPYKVKGKVYYPKEEKGYKKTGLASWYGDAFHGRLTANGEIYDMTHLTAAHPTMPLPSYARVTNLANGSSVIVRVNDRGPYSHNRLIDLSKRAAEMLDYTHTGTAKVKVEYVGRAPLDGEDDQYLMASYRPGNRAPDPSDGMPTGVMIAMNGPTPTTDVGSSGAPFDMMATGTSGLALPAEGPIAPERPAPDGLGQMQVAMASLSYADDKGSRSAGAFAALGSLTPDAVSQSWKRMNDGLVPEGEAYIAAASFTDAAEADRLAKELARYGRTEIEKTEIDNVMWYGVNLRADGRQSVDDLLEAAWSHGAPDAIVVRD
ncbi:septal ring lytic transglycosylase RlpA family protein [Mesorhizobium sp. VNQ89]|uniref:septal ring lytic transglycosylase RlpA family protein n=1 Tax=Mesorhizobium quangtriensis TaxID=3157709 RepID=UPI0032B703BC